MEPKERPHHCATCNQSFMRASHLKRHSRLHDGSYRCLCGQAFSRNDALSRHLRRCTTAQSDIETIKRFESIRSKKQIRDKRACDNCANLKLKCTFQLPCDQCRRKSLTCTCTRNGYVDPYEGFRVEKEPNRQPSEKTGEQLGPLPTVVDLQPDTSQATLHEATACGGLDDAQGNNVSYRLSQQAGFPTGTLGMADLSALAYSGIETSRLTSEPDTSDWLSMDFCEMDFDVASHLNFPFASVFDANLSSLSFDMTQQVDPPISENWAYVTGEVQGLDVASKSSSPSPGDGFTLQQLDPVEAKCTEIRELLHGAEPIIHRDHISKYITRKYLLLCSQLFGRHLSRNIPILHSPTFMLTEAPPMLLLAVILGGACYSNNAIPAKYMTKFAMALLILIERQTHEIEMKVPRMSTVQASILACCILLSSRHDGARRFASVHFARSISMADRLGVFREEAIADYTSLNEESFSWRLWIEQESRRRVACEIFCLDMAFCVFLGKSPYFSAFAFPTQMPCPEKCWEDSDPAACFRSLRDLPPQINVSTGMCELRNLGNEEGQTLQVSEFGMFTLMLALHSSLLRIIQEEPEPHSSPPSIQTLFHGIDPVSLLRQQLTGENFTVLADMLVELYGSPAMKQYNKTLKAWRRVWGQFRERNQDTKPRPFSADPLPFWYLAKLYQALYLCSDLFGGKVEFKVPMRQGSHDRWKAGDHDKIVAWLNEFREQASSKGPDTGKSESAVIGEGSGGANILPKLMKPA